MQQEEIKKNNHKNNLISFQSNPIILQNLYKFCHSRWLKCNSKMETFINTNVVTWSVLELPKKS